MPKSTFPPSSPDAMASPQHSSSLDGSTSSGYPAPYLSSDSSDSGYSWLLDRPPRLSPNFPASLHESASPHPSPETPPSPHLAEWFQGWTPEMPPSPPAMWQGLAHPLPLSSGSSEIPPSPQHTGPDWAATETYSPPGQFTPLHHSSSSSSSTEPLPWHSDEPMSTPYSLASGGSVPSHHSMPETLAPSQDLTSDGSPPSPSSPPTETPPDNAEFFNKNMNMMKKLKIVAGVALVGGVIAGIAGSQIKHHDSRDS
jgi:hypothetical protein